MFLDRKQLRAFLISAAKAKESVTYSEALASQGQAFSRPKMRALCRVLDAIDSEGRSRGEAPLAVLVVRQSDGLPGQGWWVGRTSDGYEGPWRGARAKAHVRRLQCVTFAYWIKANDF